MEFSVTRSSQAMVAPARPTPSEFLDLSVLDRVPVLRCQDRTLHVFRHGLGAAKVIREALSKALVPYYPLAGRLHDSNQNELQIACSGEGVWFVEASADCTLDAVGYLDDPLSIPHEKLLPVGPGETDGLDPLVQMQVTQFKSNGFVIGLVSCHSICDGLGAAQFVKAVGEIARGAENPTITPQWCRNFLPPPPHPDPVSTLPPIPIPIPIPIPDHELQSVTLDFSMDKIKDLKQQFHKLKGKTCSTFEIVAAMLWRQRTIAVSFDDETQMKLVFFANCRQIIKPPLPEGFYGNCFLPLTVTATCGRLSAESVFSAVELIQEAKAGLADAFGKWARNEGNGPDPFGPQLEYSTLFISDWGRLGFMEVDYGWGSPAHIVPIQLSDVVPVPASIMCYQPRPRTGVRLVTWCVSKAHLQPLLHHMNNMQTASPITI